MLVEMVDNSILTVALPTIGRDLHVGATGLQWIVGAYSLTFGGLLLIGGTLGDTLGRRRMLLVGTGRLRPELAARPRAPSPTGSWSPSAPSAAPSPR